jgi:branched-subunit amino acid transport protein
MNGLWPILGMAAGVYAVRLAGFLLADMALPADLERALGFVPVAMLAALFVSVLAGRADDAPLRVVAALGAALVVRRTRRVWACILSGMALYWFLGWLTDQL